ncbi:chemotaxis protein CheB [Sulfurimonas sp.]|uniref:chemotaxis protein CheB n=1 Tax=Sulfurimonas sp. TaxID=2022749 RepID=UPI0025EB6644|nr:chemotaxis protein CheB [Sulfurimonas sp.]MDD5157568.1 chemotaxis protein CheB [Sulfurimonas sp.]
MQKRLQELNKNSLSIASDNEIIKSWHIFFCDVDTRVEKRDLYLYFICKPSSLLNSYNPNINTIFKSLIPYTKNFKILALTLTGIGDDGVDGCCELNLNGARTITESKVLITCPFIHENALETQK